MQWYFNYIIFSSIYYRNKRKGKGSILYFRQERRETKLESLIDQPSIMYDDPDQNNNNILYIN